MVALAGIASLVCGCGSSVDDPASAACYQQAAPPDQLWQGLRRYLQTREQPLAGA